MRKPVVILVMILLLALTVTACGGDEPEAAGGAEGPVNTPTPVVLATPTPRPAPSTPTPRPTPEPAVLEEAEAEAEAEEEMPAAPAIGEDMVEVPAGAFTMGSDESAKAKNRPAHQVDLPAYEIDRFEVTNDDFGAFVEATGYTTYAEESGSSKNWRSGTEGKGNHPVVYVTWDDAQAFCEWAGKRLPTEAEWEKAARGEDGRTYPWGNEFVAENGNFYESGFRGTTAVGSFPAGASPYGVEDVAGNVREWTADYFLPYPGQTADADRFFGEENRVNRGGGWFDGKDGELVTTFNRNAGPPETSANDDIGFRCARDM